MIFTSKIPQHLKIFMDYIEVFRSIFGPGTQQSKQPHHHSSSTDEAPGMNIDIQINPDNDPGNRRGRRPRKAASIDQDPSDPTQQYRPDPGQQPAQQPAQQQAQQDASPNVSNLQYNPKLPTENQLTSAFEKLQRFSLKSILPLDLRNPSDTLPQDAKNTFDRVNLSLEKNVQMLFSPSTDEKKSELERIKAALIAYVQKIDIDLTSQKAKDTNVQKVKRVMAGVPILRFYPNLLALIKALLAYNETYIGQPSISSNEPNAFIFRAWMEVLGYLQGIQSIIVAAASGDDPLIQLQEFPLHFEDVIDRIEKERGDLKGHINREERKIAELQAKLQQQNEERLQVDLRYQGVHQALASKIVQLGNLKEHWESVTNPSIIAENNVRLL